MNKYNDELNRTVEFIKLADAKIGYVLTVYFVIFGLWVGKFDYIKSHHNALNLIFYFISLYVATTQAYYILKSLSPSLFIKNIVKNSVIYYGDISKLDINTYKKMRMDLDEANLDQLYLDQIFINSIIVSNKMKSVKTSILLMLLLLLLTFSLYLMAR